MKVNDNWRIRFAESPLALKDLGNGTARVVKLGFGAFCGRNMERIWNGYVNDQLSYDATKHFKVGQIVEIPKE